MDIEAILEMYEDDYNPSSTVPGPRNMYASGQLVSNTVDGSRPGYAGDDFVNLNDIKKYNKNLLDKSIIVSTAPGRTGANQADPVTLRNIFNVVEKTKDGDILINNFKKNPTSENFLKLRTRRKNRLAFEKEQALPAEQKAELRKKQLIAERKWRASGKGQSYYNELLAKDGIFPARTAQERVWRDIYRASKQSKEDSRFKIKYPKNIEIDPETNLPKKVKAKSGKYYIPWDRYYKKVSFYDTETKSTIKFGNMREWMKNNVKGGGKKYDNAIQNYNLRQNIADFDVDGKSLGAVAKEKKTGLYAKKLTTPAAVNHRSGLNNFWDTEITTSTGNAQLNDKVQSRISAYKNASNPNIKNKIMKQMKAEINKIQGGATLVVDGETIGKKPTLRKVSNALANELNVDLLKLAGTVNPKCRKAAVDGGRIGFQDGLSADFCINEGKKVARDLVAKNIKGSPAQNSIMKRVTSGLTNFVKSALDPKELFNLKKQFLSKGAIASLPFFDAGIAAYEATAMGKPVKEAISDTFVFGSLPRAAGVGMDTSDVLNAKQLLKDPQLSPAGKEYAQLIIDSGDYEKMQSDTTGGMTKKFTEFKEMQDKIKNASTAGRFDYESRLNEVEGTELAKDDYKPLIGSLGDPLKNRAVNKPSGTRGGKGAFKDYKIDLSPVTYENYKPYSFTKKEFEDTMRQAGALKEGQVYNDDFYKEQIETPMKASQFKEYMELPSFRGTQEKFSEGGIASLNVKK
jgi:hypothetical protein